jgi:hypothetical protein
MIVPSSAVEKASRLFTVDQLAREDDFTDVDGFQPGPFPGS